MAFGDGTYNGTFEDGEAAKRALQQQWDAGNERRRRGMQDIMAQEAAKKAQMDSTALTRNTGPRNANDSWLGTVQERANVNSPWVDRAQQPTFGQPSASGFSVGGAPTTANLGFGGARPGGFDPYANAQPMPKPAGTQADGLASFLNYRNQQPNGQGPDRSAVMPNEMQPGGGGYGNPITPDIFALGQDSRYTNPGSGGFNMPTRPGGSGSPGGPDRSAVMPKEMQPGGDRGTYQPGLDATGKPFGPLKTGQWIAQDELGSTGQRGMPEYDPSGMPGSGYSSGQVGGGVGMSMPFDPNAGMSIDAKQFGQPEQMNTPFDPNAGMSIQSSQRNSNNNSNFDRGQGFSPGQPSSPQFQPNSPPVNFGPAAQAGPAAMASGSGYSATTFDIGNEYQKMGLSNPNQANARLLSGEVNNPYLDKQADNITSRLNRNLQENVLPGIGQGATMAGQYGGSRQGIAQGKAIGDTQDNLANALTSMYGGANEAAQARMGATASNLSGIGAQVGTANAGFQNQASQFSANAANQASMANAQSTNQTNQFNAGQANAYGIAGMNNQTTMRGQDQSYGLGQGNLGLGYQNANNNFQLGQMGNQATLRGQDISQDIASQGNQTTQRGQNINQNIANISNQTALRGQDQNYALGQMGNQTAQRGQNINQNIANMGNQTTQRGQDQNYALGQGNLGLGYQNSSNAYNLGMANNQTTQRGQDLNQQVASGNLALGYQQAGNAYNLGLGNLNLGQQQAGNAYNLGLGNLNLAQQQANNSYSLGQGQLALTNQGQNQNFYSTQRGQDLQQYTIGNSIYNNGVNGQIAVGQGQYNVGQQYQNAPMYAINQYGQAISPYTGYGQTQTQSGQSGGGANGFIGGGLAAYQIANNLYGSNNRNNQQTNQ